MQGEFWADFNIKTKDALASSPFVAKSSKPVYQGALAPTPFVTLSKHKANE